METKKTPAPAAPAPKAEKPVVLKRVTSNDVGEQTGTKSSQKAEA